MAERWLATTTTLCAPLDRLKRRTRGHAVYFTEGPGPLIVRHQVSGVFRRPIVFFRSLSHPSAISQFGERLVEILHLMLHDSTTMNFKHSALQAHCNPPSSAEIVPYFHRLTLFPITIRDMAVVGRKAKRVGWMWLAALALSRARTRENRSWLQLCHRLERLLL